tara:strand:- start:4334 stop:4507 length:174 start_codon:yes stop_codon:yes gene_type:complete
MSVNKEGNEIGQIIEADNLLTQIARQRVAKKTPPVLEPKPEVITVKAVDKTTVSKKD